MKKKLLIIGIALICIDVIVLSAVYIYFDTFYSRASKKMVGTYEDFVKNGENVPAPSMKAGVNVNGFEGDWSTPLSKKYLTDIKTYMNIKKQGFDHIRFPVNFNFYYSPENNCLLDEKMKTVDTVIDLAEKAGLYIQMDFHGWYDFTTEDFEQRERFLNIWEKVAERYKDHSELLCFELISEPQIKAVSAQSLNSLQKDAVTRIRKTNPTRLIICAAPDANQAWMLDSLSLPEDDNIAVAVHTYNPGDFTHQGFEWANPPREKGVQVRLSDEMLAALQWDLNEIKKYMDKTGHKIYLNEFGLNLELADPADRSTYLRTIASWCEENDVAWTIWGYNNSEFGLFQNKKWKNDVLDDLFLR